MDIFYIDESNDKNFYVATAIAIPFLRPRNGQWHIVWPDYLQHAQQWRKGLAADLKIPTQKELHGTKLARGRGNYFYGDKQIPPRHCPEIYSRILASLDFLPAHSIISVAGAGANKQHGLRRLERVMLLLFQHMRAISLERQCNAMVFFDQGHPEYRQLYRRAQKNPPPDSLQGRLGYLPRDMFIKDGNEKISRHCLFTQIADMIAYAALAKIRHAHNMMPPQDSALYLHQIYDHLPTHLHSRPNGAGNDGIIWLAEDQRSQT